jgi:hypothetical protein
MENSHNKVLPDGTTQASTITYVDKDPVEGGIYYTIENFISFIDLSNKTLKLQEEGYDVDSMTTLEILLEPLEEDDLIEHDDPENVNWDEIDFTNRFLMELEEDEDEEDEDEEDWYEEDWDEEYWDEEDGKGLGLDKGS